MSVSIECTDPEDHPLIQMLSTDEDASCTEYSLGSLLDSFLLDLDEDVLSLTTTCSPEDAIHYKIETDHGDGVTGEATLSEMFELPRILHFVVTTSDGRTQKTSYSVTDDFHASLVAYHDQESKKRKREGEEEEEVSPAKKVKGNLEDALKDAQDQFTCCVCLDLVRDPWSGVECGNGGHLLCEKCLLGTQTARQRAVNCDHVHEVKCPQCRTIGVYIRAPYVEHILYTMEVCCERISDDEHPCSWTGSAYDHRTHPCTYGDVMCDQCSWSGLRHELEDHPCEKRCEHCDDTYPPEDEFAHMLVCTALRRENNLFCRSRHNTDGPVCTELTTMIKRVEAIVPCIRDDKKIVVHLLTPGVDGKPDRGVFELWDGATWCDLSLMLLGCGFSMTRGAYSFNTRKGRYYMQFHDQHSITSARWYRKDKIHTLEIIDQ